MKPTNETKQTDTSTLYAGELRRDGTENRYLAPIIRRPRVSSCVGTWPEVHVFGACLISRPGVPGLSAWKTCRRLTDEHTTDLGTRRTTDLDLPRARVRALPRLLAVSTLHYPSFHQTSPPLPRQVSLVDPIPPGCSGIRTLLVVPRPRMWSR